MMSFWQQCEGVVLDGRYRLERCMAERGNQALFRAESGDVPNGIAAVKVRLSDWRTDEEVLARWSAAAKLSHPNLLRMFAADSCELEGTRVIYAVMEYADDDVSAVLRSRALEAPEAREALESVLNALAYLHGSGLVHGRIKPSNIMAAGETIKISSDGLGKDGERRGAALEPTAYDAPELAAGMLSPAADVWSLGLTLVETLTRQAPGAAPNLRRLGLPFRDLIEHCLRPLAAQRWHAAQISTYLEAIGRAAPLEEAAAASTAARPPAGASRKRWIYAAAIPAALLLWFAVARRPEAPVQPQATAPPARTTRAARAAKLTQRSSPPAAAATARAGSQVWRVIVYTYRNAADARRKAQQINAKWPHFQAEVFTVKPNRAPYLVAVGGAMAREQALRVRQQARKAGLPRDSYIQNYSH